MYVFIYLVFLITVKLCFRINILSFFFKMNEEQEVDSQSRILDDQTSFTTTSIIGTVNINFYYKFY